MNQKIWISLSNKRFEPKKYKIPENCDLSVLRRFKAIVGQWYSLPDEEYISEWERFIKTSEADCLAEHIKDDTGSTHIISAKLSDETIILEWEECKEALVKVLTKNNNTISNEEKRESLVNEIRIMGKNDSIQHVVLNIKENDIKDIIDIYNKYLIGDQLLENIAYNDKLSRMEIQLRFSCWRFPYPNNDNYDKFKKQALAVIALCNKINNKEIITTEELKKTYPDEDLEHIGEFDEEIKKYTLESAQLIAKGYSSVLSVYESLLNQSNTLDEYQEEKRVLYKDAPKYSPYQSVELITDYFSGYIDAEGRLPDHDVPSLVVFDTDCLQITNQATKKLFTNKSVKEEKITIITPIQAAKSFIWQEGLQDTIEEASNQENKIQEDKASTQKEEQ